MRNIGDGMMEGGTRAERVYDYFYGKVTRGQVRMRGWVAILAERRGVLPSMI